MTNSPTRYFALTGIVVHETDWKRFIEVLILFRRTMRTVYGLPIRMEIHAAEYIRHSVLHIKKHDRLAILRNFLDELAKIPYISITNIVVDKNNKPPNYDVFTNAWGALFQRFENTLKHGNFPGAKSQDFGMVITDATNGNELTKMVRRMAVYNPIPNQFQYGPGSRNIPVVRVIEDPYGKDSRQALPIQAADVCAYFLFQSYQPNSYIKKHSAVAYFGRLLPVLNKRASKSNNFGVVNL